VFLVGKGTCAVEEGIASHVEREIGHAPKRVANAFVDVWKQTLVISTLSLSWHNPAYDLSVCGILMRLGGLDGKSIWCRVGELQCYFLAVILLQELAS